MPNVQVTRHLQRYFPALPADDFPVEGRTVAEIVAALDRRYPGFADYLTEETGGLRKHVQVFVGEEMIRDRKSLSDPVDPDSQIFIVQALSGG